MENNINKKKEKYGIRFYISMIFVAIYIIGVFLLNPLSLLIIYFTAANFLPANTIIDFIKNIIFSKTTFYIFIIFLIFSIINFFFPEN